MEYFCVFRRADVFDQVEGFRRGRLGSVARGQRQVRPDRHQVLRRAADMAHIISGQRRRLKKGHITQHSISRPLYKKVNALQQHVL